MAVGTVAVATGGCVGEDPADGLGTFAVTGELTRACADEGLLAAPTYKQFVVELKQLGTALHWIEGGERLYGSIDDDGSFLVETYLLVDMRQDAPDDELPACFVERIDQRLGTLAEDGADGYGGFTGELRYGFEPTADSDCSDLLTADPPLATELPCTIAYDLVAEPVSP